MHQQRNFCIWMKIRRVNLPPEIFLLFDCRQSNQNLHEKSNFVPLIELLFAFHAFPHINQRRLISFINFLYRGWIEVSLVNEIIVGDAATIKLWIIDRLGGAAAYLGARLWGNKICIRNSFSHAEQLSAMMNYRFELPNSVRSAFWFTTRVLHKIIIYVADFLMHEAKLSLLIWRDLWKVSVHEKQTQRWDIGMLSSVLGARWSPHREPERPKDEAERKRSQRGDIQWLH